MIKATLNQTLRVQLMILFMIIAAITAAVTSAVFTTYELHSSKADYSSRLQSLADILAPHLTASVLFEDKGTAHELIGPLTEQPGIISVTVYDQKGTIFASQTTLKEGGEPNQGLRQTTAPLVVDEHQYGELVISSNNEVITQSVQAFIGLLLTMVVVSLIFSFWIALLLSKRFTSPIASLAKIATKVTESNNYALRARNDRGDEIGALTRCFNLMLETIQHRDQTLESQVLYRTKQLKVANDKLKEQAYQDSLCELPNRRYLLELMESLTTEAVNPQPFSLMFIDLDGFKDVNDSLGHDAGDALIIAAAKRLRATLKEQDFLARLGGDEFTVLIQGELPVAHLAAIADKLQAQLASPFQIAGEKVCVSGSIGISHFPSSGHTAGAIMKAADLAMYDAKAKGRNCYRFFEDSMLERLQEKLQMLQDLQLAIERNEFELHFQPIVNLSTGLIDKAEGLLRWHHPEKGNVPPDKFIPLAEEAGLINEIGVWVSEQAVEAVVDLRQRYSPDFTVTINVSPIQFRKESSWLSEFLYLLDVANLEPNALGIEITEHTLMDSDQTVLDKLVLLNRKGVEIAIDDFGVGYSSLSYLQKLDVDMLKIDRSFIQQLRQDNASGILCRTIINMAKNLNMMVVAEGIEYEEQQSLLYEFGCHFGQGYYFSKPLRKPDLENILAQRFQTNLPAEALIP